MTQLENRDIVAILYIIQGISWRVFVLSSQIVGSLFNKQTTICEDSQIVVDFGKEEKSLWRRFLVF